MHDGAEVRLHLDALQAEASEAQRCSGQSVVVRINDSLTSIQTLFESGVLGAQGREVCEECARAVQVIANLCAIPEERASLIGLSDSYRHAADPKSGVRDDRALTPSASVSCPAPALLLVP